MKREFMRFKLIVLALIVGMQGVAPAFVPAEARTLPDMPSTPSRALPGNAAAHLQRITGPRILGLTSTDVQPSTHVFTGTIPSISELGFDPGPWQAPKINADYGQILMQCDVCPLPDDTANSMNDILDSVTLNDGNASLNNGHAPLSNGSAPLNDGEVSLHNGEFTLEAVDLRIPGRGFDFEFRRTYKSQIQYQGPLGFRWQHNYDQFLIRSGTTITVVDGLARADAYTSTDGINFTSPSGFYTRLIKNVNGTYTLHNAHGGRADFNALDLSPAQGELARLTDASGDTMSFQYNGLGQLATVVDTLGRSIVYSYTAGLLDHIQDYTGRRVSFGYSNGDLITVTLPAVTGTVTNNNFPNGKSWRYTYSSGFANSRLNHNLISVIAPNEVADGSLTPRLVNTYGTNPATYGFDRVVQQVRGGTNASTEPAGGTIVITYTQLNAGGDPTNLNLPRNRTTVVDRNGNQKIYEHNINGNRLTFTEFSNRGLRPSDPASWTTTYTYDRDGQLITETSPLGNIHRRGYDASNPDRLRQGNVLMDVNVADVTRGGDQTAITTTFNYEPIYNHVRSVTEARGNDPSYKPQNTGAWSPARYTTINTFDYEEGCDFAAIGAKVGLTTTTAQLVLAGAGMCLAPLGDINGDGLTNQANGNIIRVQQPTVTLLAGSNEAVVEGSTAQPHVTLNSYNAYGQLVRVRDAEGNVDTYEYYPSTDPDGDGIIDNPGGDPFTGGYLKQVTRDTVSASGRDSNTNPAPANVRSLYHYDPVGNVIRMVDGRGIATDYAVNQLNQVVQVTLAAAHGLFTPTVPEPVTLTDFAYRERTFYDYNNNVVLSEVEDRGNTSNVAGSPFSYDLPPYIINPDPLGGATAYADTVFQYDILDQRFAMLQELSNGGSPNFLRTIYHYDPNGNQVLVIEPLGNAVAAVFDERDLLYQVIRGATAPPALALLSGIEVTNYNIRGGIPATTTYHYDANSNLIETVAAADEDGSLANNSKLGGVGDRTRMIYDGFDRRTSVVDSVGNQTVYQYDPDGNVVRVSRFGSVGGASPVTDGPDTLAVPVSSAGVIQSAHLVNLNLLESTAKLFDELSRAYQTDRSLFVNTISTVRSINIAPGATDIGLGNLNPGATCAVPGAVAPPSGYLGCVSTRLEYDRNSRTTFTVLDDGATTRAFYDGMDRPVKRLDPANNTLEMAYDGNNNTIEIRTTDVSQVVGVASEQFLTTNFYDSLDRLQQTVDNLGHTTDYRYDSRGNRVAVADAQGPVGPAITRRAFSGGALTINTTNLFGNVTLYYYDGLNRQTRVEQVLTASGQGDGAHIGATLEGIMTTTPVPDSTQGGGDGLIRTGTLWDGDSLQTALIDDQGNVTFYLYDNLNRKVMETKGVTVNTAPLNTLRVLGSRHLLAPTVPTINDPAILVPSIDAELAMVKGQLNAVSSLFPPLANQVDDNPPTTIILGYDQNDNLLILADENASATYSKYDAIGRRIAVRVFRKGQSDSFAGDPIFAPSPGSIPSNPSTNFPAVVGTTKQDFQYDGLGRLTRATDNNDPADIAGASIVTDAYDSLSRLVEEMQQMGSLPAYAISSAWRADNLRSEITYPNGRAILQTYDNLSRLKTVADTPYALYLPDIMRGVAIANTDASPNVASSPSSTGLLSAYPLAIYSYIGTGRVLQRVDSNGVRMTYLDSAGHSDIGYDGLGRPIQLRHLRADNSLVVGFTYTYDRVDNKLSEDKLHNPANNEVYSYDSAHRLLQFSRPMAGSIAPLQSNWKLDGAGNWKQVDSEVRLHSSFNEITARGGIPILSDDNGNEFDNGTYLFNWDYQNHLRTVRRKSDNALIAVYSYDALGRRIRQVVTNSAGLNGTTAFYLDGWQEIEERDGANSLKQQYVYGTYIDEPLVLDRNLNGDGSATGSGDQRLFYHQNASNSVIALTDNTGKIVEGYQYDAYGRQTVFRPGLNGVVDFGADDVITVGGVSALSNPFLFTGRRLDRETELYYYRNRYYDPESGRFLSRDPLGPVDSLNLYEFAYNSPINFRDPLGLDVWVEGSSGNEPAGHQSLCVGDPKGEYECFSFGVGSGPFTWKYGLTGEVYQDTELGGAIVEDKYYKTSKAVDALIIRKLRTLLWRRYKYRILNWNCRTWSQEQFALIAKELEKYGKGQKAKPPKREPPPTGNGVGPSTRSTSRSTSEPTTNLGHPTTSTTRPSSTVSPTSSSQDTPPTTGPTTPPLQPTTLPGDIADPRFPGGRRP